MSASIPTNAEVELMTPAQLVTSYNALAEKVGQKTVKKFETRAVGVKRLSAVVDALRAAVEKVGAERQAAPTPEIEKIQAPIAPNGSKVRPAKANGHVVDKKPSFASRCRELIAEGKTNAEVWAVLAPEFGYDEKTAVQRTHPGWHRSDMKRRGVV